jgi:predicted metal-binding membrane protein
VITHLRGMPAGPSRSLRSVEDVSQATVGVGRFSQQAFFGLLVLLFAGSTGLTILWCTSMSGGMPMPGGWTMSMAWMRMPGQTWLEAAASFVGMWVLMMVAMMLPSLTAMLERYRQVVVVGRAGDGRLGRLTALAGVGYFFAWTVFGMAVFPLGVALAAVEMQHEELARAVPFAVGVTVLAAGAIQFTAWKAHYLACCRETPVSADGNVLTSYVEAVRYGLGLGVRCSCCCANLMAILLAIGVMDLRVMAAVTAAITVERLAPGERIARLVGAAVIATGLFLIAQAAGMA